ncbi:MAG: Ig-like domain-containing protein [FCB group bacterium]|nr:Ig-like domain-containing protein [FCB group bacterium]
MRRFLFILLIPFIYSCSAETNTVTDSIPVEDEKEPQADTTLPFVISTSPARGESYVAVDCAIEVLFSEDMNPATITEATFYFSDSIPATVNYDNKTATLTPLDTLEQGRDYLVYVLLTVTDMAGNRMEDHYRLDFSTVQAPPPPPPPDTIRPYILSINPADGDTVIPYSTTISVIFSEPLDESTINLSNIYLDPHVSGSLSYSDETVIFIPDSILMRDTVYEIIVCGCIADTAGNTMGDDYRWSISTDYEDLMPLAIGNQWVYRVDSRDSLYYNVEISYDTVLIKDSVLRDDEYWYYVDGGGYFQNKDDGLWNIINGMEQLFLKHPAVVGDEYGFSPYPQYSWLGTRMTLISKDTLVEVPAGTFSCYLYVCEVYDVYTMYDSYFYAPGIGMVKKIHDPGAMIYFGGKQVVKHLESYQIQQ